MKKVIYTIISFSLLLFGCQNNNDVNEIESQITALENENNSLMNEIQDRNITIKKLNQEISDLKHEKEPTSENNNKMNKLKQITINNGRMFYQIEKTSFSNQYITIIGNEAEGLIEYDEKIYVNGIGSGETFEIQVIGSVFDFQLIEVKHDAEKKDFVAVNVLYDEKEVRNQIIEIETYLPEGLPVEKIRWKDGTGEFHEVYLSYDGFGFDGSIIWSN